MTNNELERCGKEQLRHNFGNYTSIYFKSFRDKINEQIESYTFPLAQNI
jgi:hypothetical protein